MLLKEIAAKRERLQKLPRLSPATLGRRQHHHNVEITYASNAIDGIALSLVETRR